MVVQLNHYFLAVASLFISFWYRFKPGQKSPLNHLLKFVKQKFDHHWSGDHSRKILFIIAESNVLNSSLSFAVSAEALKESVLEVFL